MSAELATELVLVERPEPHLAAVPRPIRSQRANLSDGWVLFVPIAGTATGVMVNQFGVFGVAASVVGGLVVAAWVSVVPKVASRRHLTRHQFVARERLAITAGKP